MNENYLILDVVFTPAGKVYRFISDNLNLKVGSKVVAEEERGVDIGVVISEGVFTDAAEDGLKRIIREATEEDIIKQRENRALENEALPLCKTFVKECGLDIKVVKARYLLERDKIIFYFFSEKRVDFRPLIKKLAAHFNTKIEMRQIGVKDETKMLGGIGICGRVLCCSSFMREFAPVTMKMVKDQGLILNPSKYTGICRRLMCCLYFENYLYVEMKKGLPSVGKIIETEEGRAKVISVNILKRSYLIRNEKGEVKEIFVDHRTEEMGDE